MIDSTTARSRSIDLLTEKIIGAAIEVHRQLGPGLLESAYEISLSHELHLRGLDVARQVPVKLSYKGINLGVTFRIDFLVADLVVVEVKAVPKLSPVFDAQLATYLKIGGWPVGLLLNFNVVLMRDGVRRKEP